MLAAAATDDEGILGLSADLTVRASMGIEGGTA
jgi:hypothetical protein